MEIRTRTRNRNRILGAVLLATAAVFAVYGLWPTSYRTETFDLESNHLPQPYRLEVRYPRFGPSGEIVEVTATLVPQEGTASFPPPGEASPVIVAEIQSGSIAFSPAGQVSTPLQEGKTVHFSWSALSESAGDGTFNLFIFKSGAEQAEGVYLQQPVWARVFPYDTFPGPQGLKLPLLFFAVFGGVFGLGLLIVNTLPGTVRHADLLRRRQEKIR
jgi:hypothetical protein